MNIYTVTYQYLEQGQIVTDKYTSSVLYEAVDPTAVKRAATERFHRCFPTDELINVEVHTAVIDKL